jgi:tetratricopeptide (TPR) repeat protein
MARKVTVLALSCPWLSLYEKTLTDISIRGKIMTPRFLPTAQTSESHQAEPRPSNSTPTRHFGRRLLAPTVLALGLIAAACNSSSDSGDSSAAASANALTAQGLKAETSGQIQQAVKDFNAAIAKDPVNQVPYFDLGTIYQEHLSDPTQAAAYYNKALLADPNYKPALYNLATLEATTNPQGAITLYNQLLKLDPKQPSALFNLGLLLIQQNQNEVLQGHQYLKQAIALEPSLTSRVPAGITP